MEHEAKFDMTGQSYMLSVVPTYVGVIPSAKMLLMLSPGSPHIRGGDSKTKDDELFSYE